jgi:Na+-driven multidrug efflux pump
VNVTSLWIFRAIPSYLAYKFGYGVIAIFIIMNIETLIKGVIFWYIYQKRSWLKIQI